MQGRFKHFFTGLLVVLLASGWLITTPVFSAQVVAITSKDTLWSISRTYRPNDKLTIKQVMLAIQAANPQAFPSGNINEMEVTQRLTIPSTAAMNRLSPSQAEQEVRRQNQVWVASKAAPQPKPKTVQQPVTKVSNPVAPNVNNTLTPTLSLEAGATSNTKIQQLETSLNASEENIQLLEREKDQLAENLSAVQKQVSTLQQLIQLKDQQLAEMEQQALTSGIISQPSGQHIAPLPEADDLASQIKRQPELYGALAGTAFLSLVLLFALRSARKKLKMAQKQPAPVAMPQFAEDQATSKDFDLDINSQPLGADLTSAGLVGMPNLDQLDDLEELESSTSLDSFDELDTLDSLTQSPDLNDLDATLDDLEQELNLEPSLSIDLETELNENTPLIENPTFNLDSLIDLTETPAPLDPMAEVEPLIAYGRLEQAAGLLQAALEQEPANEAMRLKLLEVLVGLNDEETFMQQQQFLTSSSAQDTALELARGFVDAQDDSTQELSLDELDLSDLSLDDLELADLDRADPSTSLEITAPTEPNLDLTNALDELDELELDKPLSESELNEQSSLDTDFAPVSYKSEADDFLDALDSLDDEDFLPLENSGLETPQPEPGIEEELAALNANLAELEALAETSVEAVSEPEQLANSEEASINLEDLDDLANFDLDLSNFNDLSLDDQPLAIDTQESLRAPSNLDLDVANMDLSDLDDLDSLDLDLDLDLDGLGGSESGMTSQLDLATAYIEMGDNQGAREILEKVITSADADARATAEQMLASLT